MRTVLSSIIFLMTTLICMASNTDRITIVEENNEGSFVISKGDKSAPIIYDSENDHTVVGIVANAVSGDIYDITDNKPFVGNIIPENSCPIIAGTIGQSSFIDSLISNGKINVSQIEHKWEAYMLEIVPHPFEGISQALVITGSTPRGTAYGLFELSKLMGVSPWIWWADVKPEPRKNLYATSGKIIVDEPSVKFRGIFINDEDWGLQPWAASNMDKNIQDIGPRTYERVFELLLRLRANYIWPAMHECTKAFWYYPENPVLAKKYNIVLGSSHCEPMLRNNVFEWFNEGGTKNNYNFATNASGVTNYWRKRVVQSKDQDAVYTVGMRGVHDGAISGYSGASNIAAGLSNIIATQRQLIQENIGDPTKIPQMFCPYKEVLEAYNTGGINLPDDITLTWVDDNHGYIRQFPTPTEQKRSGSHGIYYHLSYWGSPHDYLWLSTISPSLISYELCRGYSQGIQRLWVINVGDIKPAEEELEFCMDLAWDIEAWNPENASSYSQEWASRIFGKNVSNEIGEIKQEYYRLAAGGKPEHISSVTYSRDEMDKRIEAYKKISDKVDEVKTKIPLRLQDAYYQLIEYPVKSAYKMNIKHFRAKESFDYASAGMKEEAMQATAEAKEAFNDIISMTDIYNKEISGGKWNGIMSWKPRGLATFNMPSTANYDDVSSYRSDLEKVNEIIIPASSCVSSSSSLTKIAGLGLESDALTSWPMDLTAYSQTNLSSAPCSEYDIPVCKGVNKIKVRCLPTFPLNSSYNLRYAIMIDDQNAIVQSIKTAATSNVWNQNVLRGWSGGTHNYISDSDKTIRVTIYFMDPGLVLSDIVCEQPNETLADQLMINPDFEYKAENVLNSGGTTVRGIPYGWNINTTFEGDSYGINNDGSNIHGDNLCWFYNKTTAMPDFFQLSQTIKGMKAGTYCVKCRLWAQSGNLGTVRLFANNNVQYYGKASDYKNNLTEGEINTFAGYSGTSSAELKEMQVVVTISEGECLTLGVRTSNQKSDGSRATSSSDHTGWFKCDYFRIEPYNGVAGIINPGFGQETTGWTIDYTGTANVKISTASKPENTYSPIIDADQNHLQIWGINGTCNVSQLVTGLENGLYEIGVSICKSGNINILLFAGEEVLTITKNGTYSVQAEVTDGTIRLGVECNSSSGATIDIDSFSLQLISPSVSISTPTTFSERENECIYDLSGRKTTITGKGIYIINGRKIYVL